MLVEEANIPAASIPSAYCGELDGDAAPIPGFAEVEPQVKGWISRHPPVGGAGLGDS